MSLPLFPLSLKIGFSIMHHNPILCEFYLQRNLVFFSVYVKSITLCSCGRQQLRSSYEEMSGNSWDKKLAFFIHPMNKNHQWDRLVLVLARLCVCETTPSLKKKKGHGTHHSQTGCWDCVGPKTGIFYSWILEKWTKLYQNGCAP